MIPYLDAGFLLAILVKADGAGMANRALQRFAAPFALNFLHQLQAENLLVGCQKSVQPEKQSLGNEGFQTWRYYLAEGVFQLVPTDWDSAFRVAVAWNSQAVVAPPSPLLMLHPALATTAGASHFLSFDARSRAVAKTMGLKLVPDNV